MEDKFVLLSLNDKKSDNIGKIMSNATAKKILDYIGDHDKVSPIEISKKLNLALNTVTYNLDLLEKEGLIEKKDFAWSEKGKKVILYSIANKMILIVPKGYDWKSSLKNLLPVFIIGAVISVGLKLWDIYNNTTRAVDTLAIEATKEVSYELTDASSLAIAAQTHYWLYAVLITLGVALIISTLTITAFTESPFLK